ncbi:hypothetical protein H0H93_013311 [Arthromyces matolae]|nr:hypothetical protein H0H93_013311 [Arthromyces matolae]
MNSVKEVMQRCQPSHATAGTSRRRPWRLRATLSNNPAFNADSRVILGTTNYIPSLCELSNLKTKCFRLREVWGNMRRILDYNLGDIAVTPGPPSYVSAAVACTTVNINGFTVPGGQALTLSLLSGTTVNLSE